MTEQVQLVASYWTLAGGAEPHTDHEYSKFSFNDRVTAAAQAGFDGFGIWHADLEHTLKSQSLRDMRRTLDDNGMTHIELEFLTDWWFQDGERRAACEQRKRLLLDAASALNAHHIKVGDFLDTPCPMRQLIDAFAALCTEAESHGTDVLFELMPFANIKTLAGALELLEGAGARNGGIIIDLWHMVKLGIAYDDVARIPARFLGGIELNDGTFQAPWDMHEDTINHRRLCGEGEFDVRGFVSTMLAAGYRGPWGIEVLNAEMRNWPLERMAQRAAATTRAQFAR
ncbi:MAG TPA: sugar phosphate isomerase/epimerase family protein [Steroidobacteraceae bacterium]|jgi:sugar phosphate isomerase/epimerase|nr:sugar phosphate isomerase/epimerase family protein [Steroidobacteraceae bacterium]